MNESLLNHSNGVWNELKDSYLDYTFALQRFLGQDIERVDLMKNKLMGQDRAVAVMMLQHLDWQELSELFDELIFLASFSHGAIQQIREAILRLPKDWVLTRIQNAAEPILRNGSYDEYRRLLELYSLLDPVLTESLAERAIEHPDEDIREAGEDFKT